MMNYRSEIDGLRAVAVLAVVLFHAGSETFSGGYTGVDVFFVISGFLITGLIMSDIRESRFDMRVFWLRRIRRILPALLFVMLVATVLFIAVYPPILLRNFGQSVMAQSLFGSNILFMLKSGYFDTEAHAKPLLHTWSLSVEEQFYFVIPILLWFLARLRARAPLFAMIAIAGVSLLACVWATYRYPNAAFYLLPTRAWELAVGSILALSLLGNGGTRLASNAGALDIRGSQWLWEIMAALGLVAILVAAVAFDKNTLFPGYTAVLPVLGAAAFIWANTRRATLMGKLLSLKPIVAIGLISYSLYLWHWVALVFNRAIHMEEPSDASKAIAIAVSLAVAALSYFLFESPIRRKTMLKSDRSLLLFCGVSTALLFVIGLGLHVTHGLPQRIDATAFKTYEAALSKNPRSRQCYNLYRRRDQKLVCRSEQGSKTAETDLLIWGDSHADAFYPTLEKVAQTTGVPFYFTALGGCPSVWNLYVINASIRKLCKEYNDSVIRFIEEKNIKSVILINRFNVYVNSWDQYERERRDRFVTSDPNAFSSTRDKALADFKTQFSAMVTHLKARGTLVYVVPQIPNFNVHIPDYYLKAYLLGYPLQHERSTEALLKRSSALDTFFGELDVELIDLKSVFCSEKVCRAFKDGIPLYRDDDHLSIAGGRLVEDHFTRVFERASQPK